MKNLIINIMMIMLLPAVLTAQFTGGTGIGSTVATTNNTPLPVNLASFNSSVNGQDIKLFWTTITEQNNAGFEIQRLNVNTANNGYNNIGYVEGSGTINSAAHYVYEDKKLDCGKYQYRLKQIDYNGNFEYHNLNGDVEVGVPTKYEMSQNYPNPFNPTTKIDFALPADGKVSLKIYDITGKEILSIINNEFRSAGFYTINMNASSLSSGVYFYRMTSDKFNQVKKMAVIK